MDTSKLINATVRVAFEAWQAGDSPAWLSCFTPDATLSDDGRTRDSHQFSTQTIGHERFTRIDRVEDDGKAIYGGFHSEEWGDFNTFFRFRLNRDGKIDQLAIGQAE